VGRLRVPLDPGPEDRGRRAQPNNLAQALDQGLILRVDQRTTSQGNHAPPEAFELLACLALTSTETFLPFCREDLLDCRAGGFNNLGIQVDKLPSELFG
jgi:hypothetical protein